MFADRSCYDCGSTSPALHTELCDLAPNNARRVLSSVPGTQRWDRVESEFGDSDRWLQKLVKDHGYCEVAEAFEVAEGDSDRILAFLQSEA